MVHNQGWTEAADLRAGDILVTPAGTARIDLVDVEDRNETVYNFRVDTHHNYYVYAGDTAVLVHNAGGGPTPLPTQMDGRNQPLTNKQASDLAAYLGYRPTGGLSRGQKIFTDGKNYISQDIGNGSHNGGTWKIGKSQKALTTKAMRGATTDALLTPIGC